MQPFHSGGARWQVSRGGGEHAYWNANGREIFYRRGTGLYAVAVTPSMGDFQIAVPKKLFEGPYDTDYGARPDGRQFAMFQTESAPRITQIHLIVNWAVELGR